MSHESSNSHVPTHSGAAASSSTTTTRVGSCAASRARVKARATSSGEFRRRVRALKLVSIARADARRAIRLRTSMASADDAAATWERIVRLASAPDVCDLGQGWPDFGESVAATTAAARAMTGGDARANQYAPVRGRKELTEALMRYYERTGYSVGSEESIVVTCSGTEALYGAFQAAMRAAPEGAREFVFVEPFFPWYKAIADDVGATCVVIRAIAEDGFVVDVDAIRRACVSGRTCAIVSCSPHNPSGHVLSRKELEGIAAIAEEKDLFVISDEVYERSVFDPALEHVRLATIGDMRDRTVTIGSASKLLNLTGWRVGWAVGPPKMIDAIKSAHSLMSYAAPTPLQLGVAAALDEISADARSPRGRVVPDENAAVMADNARTLAHALEDAGLTVYHPEGGYFLSCDVSSTGASDVDFCVELASHAKVAAVPLSVFFLPSADVPRSLVRFAVCKKPDTVRESADRIRRHFARE